MVLGHHGGTSGGWGDGGVNFWLGLRNASMFTNKPALFLALFAFVAYFYFFGARTGKHAAGNN